MNTYLFFPYSLLPFYRGRAGIDRNHHLLCSPLALASLRLLLQLTSKSCMNWGHGLPLSLVESNCIWREAHTTTTTMTPPLRGAGTAAIDAHKIIMNTHVWYKSWMILIRNNFISKKHFSIIGLKIKKRTLFLSGINWKKIIFLNFLFVFFHDWRIPSKIIVVVPFSMF